VRLTQEIGFEVPLESDQAEAKANETRSGLRELGLDDDEDVT